MGEPSGIGPEVAVKAYAKLKGRIGSRALRLIGDAGTYSAAAKTSGIDPGAIDGAVFQSGPAIRAEPGKPSPANAKSVTGAIEDGVRQAQTGEIAALVTAPIHKSVLTASGFGFPGHTEFLAALTGAKRSVMMLASSGLNPKLNVVPLTIHIPLRDVFAALTQDLIVETAEIVLAALKSDFGIARPRLSVAGLNPHAGEDGTMGNEDIEILTPAITALRAKQHDVTGPLSADTLFHEDARKSYDAALCMYHDQALIPIKTLAFWTGVNVTLGLPIVRTSPDHGTALAIAGRGIANEESMIAAIEMAAEIANRRAQGRGR
jgi:4-hydroxythreonine-4-phosphate dehydrogenase